MTKANTLEGFPVVDAIAELHFKISKTDKRGARPLDPQKCVLFKAIKRQFKADGVRAYRSKLYVLKEKKWVRFNVPNMLRTQIVAYDQGAQFEEGAYRLDPPTPADVLGARDKYNRTNDARTSHETTEGARPRRAPIYHASPRRARAPVKV